MSGLEEIVKENMNENKWKESNLIVFQCWRQSRIYYNVLYLDFKLKLVFFQIGVSERF